MEILEAFREVTLHAVGGSQRQSAPAGAGSGLSIVDPRDLVKAHEIIAFVIVVAVHHRI